MKYAVKFTNVITNDVFTLMGFNTPAFTKRQYDIIVRELFEAAAESIDNRALVAEVFHNVDPSKIPDDMCHSTRIGCDTLVDGSTITARITVNNNHVRDMVIAC